MKFILYTAFNNAGDIQIVYDTDAEIRNKFLLRTDTKTNRGYNKDVYSFDFFNDDQFEKESPEKLNTCIRIYQRNPEEYDELYAHLNPIQRLRLYRKFNRLWIQKTSNIQWIMNLAIALMAVIVSYFAIVSDRKKDEKKQDLIKMPIDSTVEASISDNSSDVIIDCDSLKIVVHKNPNCTLTLYNDFAQLVLRMDSVNDKNLQTEIKDRDSGLYFYDVEIDGKIISEGKLKID